MDSNLYHIDENNNLKKSKNSKKSETYNKKIKDGNSNSNYVNENEGKIKNNNELNDEKENNLNCCIGTEEMFRDEQILQELNNANKINEEDENDNDNEKNDEESLYKLNIRDTTPDKVRENVVIPSNKYNDFFDVENINEL